MLRWLGSSRFRRFVLGLVLVTYLPVVSATVACQIACAMKMSPHASVHHMGPEEGKPTSANEAAHLSHGGPCNLASVPTMCSADFRLFDDIPASRLSMPAGAHPASYVGPPPEHKPRT